MNKKNRKIFHHVFACCMISVMMLLNATASNADTSDSEKSDVTIMFDSTAQSPINVYRPEDGNYDHQMTPASDQTLVYARSIKFGTVLNPASGTASFNPLPGVMAVQATDLRPTNSVNGGWKITAALSKFKNLDSGSIDTFTSGAKLALTNGDLLVGAVRGADQVALQYDADTSPAAAVAMSPTVTYGVELEAGGLETKIANTTANNSPFAWIIRWTGTADTNGNGGVKLTIANASEISNVPYMATILWKFQDTP